MKEQKIKKYLKEAARLPLTIKKIDAFNYPNGKEYDLAEKVNEIIKHVNMIVEYLEEREK
jgi:hypothetical protein